MYRVMAYTFIGFRVCASSAFGIRVQSLARGFERNKLRGYGKSPSNSVTASIRKVQSSKSSGA